MYGNNAKFREDQLKAIISTVTNHATLVVERTVWGNSLIYFLATKYLRDKGSAHTLIVAIKITYAKSKKADASFWNANLKI